MATVVEHYRKVLSDVYSWMVGGFEEGVEINRRFFSDHKILPQGKMMAVDLGAGCGFQSIALAELGFHVTAIDLDAGLLDELTGNCGDLPIARVQDNLLNFQSHLTSSVELIICMTDTLLHLDSSEQVVLLFERVHGALVEDGIFIITFRDLTIRLDGLERFIPVRCDENRILTCFLEYEENRVKVHDILYERIQGKWQLRKSFYQKLRLDRSWMVKKLKQQGFGVVEAVMENGMVALLAKK